MSKHGITTQFGHKATKAFGGNGYNVLHFAFPNGYTASVIPETLSRDNLHELAVLKDGSFTYSTPITGDVIRFATVEEISQLITKISKL